MPGDDHDIDDTIVDALQAVTGILAGIALGSVEAEGEGLTLGQFRVLGLLDGMGDSLTGRVATMLRVDASTVTRYADRLVKTGHIERKPDPAHRGRVMLCLTDKGKRVVRRVRAHRHEQLARILGKMPPGQLAAATAALRLFVLVAREDPPPLPPWA